MSDFTSSEAGRTSRKIVAPPGGGSSISFGSEAPAGSTPMKAAPEPVAVHAPEEPAAEPAVEPAVEVDTLESLKLKTLAKISLISKDSAEVRAALSTMMKELEAAGVRVPVPVKTDSALATLQSALKARGVHGIISLGRTFRLMDEDHDNKISFDEFRKSLAEFGVELSQQDLHLLFRHFDADCSGYLSLNELLFGLRGKLNERRLAMVKLAFKVLDQAGTGSVTVADIAKRYDASQHPEVILGVKQPEAVFLEFMETFEAYGGGEKGDGVITEEEFERYYGAISSNIDEDDYFELVIRNAWHISGGEGWCANTTCRRVLVLHTDGRQTVEEVTDDFDINTKNVEEVKRALEAQGVKDIKGVALYAMPTFSSAEPTAEPPSPAPSPMTTGRLSTPDPAGSNRKNVMTSSIVFG